MRNRSAWKSPFRNARGLPEKEEIFQGKKNPVKTKYFQKAPKATNNFKMSTKDRRP